MWTYIRLGMLYRYMMQFIIFSALLANEQPSNERLDEVCTDSICHISGVE